MYENFTDRARQAVQFANEEALQVNHEYIGTEHLLLGLVDVQDGIATEVLVNFGVNREKIRSEVLKIVQSGPHVLTMGKLPQTPRAKKVIEYSVEEARNLKHDQVDTEHILLGLLREQEGVASQILMNLGLKLDRVRREVLKTLGQEPTHDFTEVVGGARKVVSKYSIFRILDAAANRAVEGLRVVEDFTRFVLDDGHLTRLAKELRHDLADTINTLPRSDRHAMRDTQQDVGTVISTPTETARTDAVDVCEASCERVKQSLRSLEEFSKTIARDAASRFEALRYRWYTLEKALSTRLRFRDELGHAKLCVLIDGSFTIEKIHQLIEAGVGMIQLRDKQLDDRELLKCARSLCHAAKVPRQDGGAMCLVIINDRPDIAVAANADGVHLGQEDLPVKAARAILGPRKIIGVSTHNIEQARAAVLDGANYLGVGPTFPSSTKAFDAFPGTALLKQVAEEISLPAFAIGGITLENLPEVLDTGIKRVAVSGAIAKAEKPGEVVREFASMLSI